VRLLTADSAAPRRMRPASGSRARAHAPGAGRWRS